MKTLFKNGTIYDGAKSKPYAADLCIEGERILQIGANLECEAEAVVDCQGMAIAPGFIDAHSHNDWFIARQNNGRFFKPFLEQGITTQVAGNCGFSPFGFDTDTPYKHLIGSGLFSIGDVKGETAALPQFAAAIHKMPVNLVPLLGHGSPRIGLSGYANRALSEAELVRMDAIIEQSLEAGAAGLSFGLMYEPDRYAPYAELKRAAKIVAKHGKILTVHGRALSAVSTSYSPPVGGQAHNLRALEEMAAIARETGVKLQYSHLIFVGERSWGTVEGAFKIIDGLTREGLPFGYDSFSLMFGASVITVVMPAWFLSLPKEQRKSWSARARLNVEVALTKKLLGFDFNDVVIAWIGTGHEDLVGKTVAQIAEQWGVSHLEAYLRLVELSEGRGRVLQHRYLTPGILGQLMGDERCLYMTDAWVEEEGKQNPSCFMCFPEFLRLARETGMRTEQAIRQMTGATADRFQITGRGYIKEGYYADLVVFDAENIRPGTSDEGRPEGIAAVYVNGRQAVEDGAYQENVSAGKLLLQN